MKKESKGGDFSNPKTLEGHILLMDYQMSLPGNNTEVFPAARAASLIEEGLINNFREFEEGLRKCKRDVYFIAEEMNRYRDLRRKGLRVIYPGKREGVPRFVLRVLIDDDPQVAENYLNKISSYEELNLKRLEETGILVPHFDA